MAYVFYLGGTALPVTPSKVQFKINGNNKTAELINDGEINIIKPTGLTDISFEALIPFTKYPFANYPDGFKTQDYYLGVFEKLKTSKEPFQLIITRTTPGGQYLYDTNIKVTLEDYTITEDAEKYGFDLGVSFEFKQYRNYCTKTLTLKKTNTETASSGTTSSSSGTTKQIAEVKQNRASSKTTAGTHKVKEGETLWAICKKELGDGSKYAEIAKLNNISNPNLIYPGQIIKLS